MAVLLHLLVHLRRAFVGLVVGRSGLPEDKAGDNLMATLHEGVEGVGGIAGNLLAELHILLPVQHSEASGTHIVHHAVQFVGAVGIHTVRDYEHPGNTVEVDIVQPAAEA